MPLSSYRFILERQQDGVLWNEVQALDNPGRGYGGFDIEQFLPRVTIPDYLATQKNIDLTREAILEKGYRILEERNGKT